MAKVIRFKKSRHRRKPPGRSGRVFYFLRRLLGLTIVIAFLGFLYAQEFGFPKLAWKAAPASSVLEGRASVIDGDTIEIHGQRIRINGIDAPESDQICTDAKGARYRCGAEAARYLQLFLQRSAPTRCDFVEWDRYGRFVADCFRADRLNVAEALVRGGHALDWPKYSHGAYAQIQEEAKADRFGIWAGEFELPWDYRARTRADDAQKPASPSLIGRYTGLIGNFTAKNCNIKGNISLNTGERIYHVPGQEYYTRTRISLLKGERWFCSEEEARAAGWRRARR